MNNLDSRIEALESKLYVDDDEQPEGVFCYVVDGRKDAPPPKPVKGWRRGEDQILRAENETDKALAKRAIAQVKPFMVKNAVPCFHSINEGDQGSASRAVHITGKSPKQLKRFGNELKSKKKLRG